MCCVQSSGYNFFLFCFFVRTRNQNAIILQSKEHVIIYLNEGIGTQRRERRKKHLNFTKEKKISIHNIFELFFTWKF